MTKCWVILMVLLSSCGAIRKLSKVELRNPASNRDRAEISETRQRVSSYHEMPKRCPAEIRKTFPYLAGEIIKFPPCPAELDQFQSASTFLNMEERTTLEEVIGSQCQSIGRSQFSDSLEYILANFEGVGPKGRAREARADESALQILEKLRIGIESTVKIHLPLDRWVERNGFFLLPEEDLLYMDKLFVNQQCKMTDQEVDQTYRTMRALEDLTHILQEGEQKKSIERFLEGAHSVIDQKVREYFYP